MSASLLCQQVRQGASQGGERNYQQGPALTIAGLEVRLAQQTWLQAGRAETSEQTLRSAPAQKTPGDELRTTTQRVLRSWLSSRSASPSSRSSWRPVSVSQPDLKAPFGCVWQWQHTAFTGDVGELLKAI